MKKQVFVLLLIVLTAPICSFATGLGLRSNNLVVGINYEPGFQETYGYSVVLYGDETRDIQLYVKDTDKDGTNTEMAKYFTLSHDIIKNVKPSEEPIFYVTVNLPSLIFEPGTHKVNVGALELLENKGGFGVRTAIEAVFFVNVPHQGQYLSYTLKAESVNQGDPLKAELSMINYGVEEIKNLYADFRLFDFNKKVVGEAKTETISLAKNKGETLSVEISTSNLLPGTHTINATIYYDGKEASASKEVRVGELNIRIINYTDTITAGKINEMWVNVESHWADVIKDVYAEIIIGNSEIARSLGVDLKGFETAKLKAFFDAKDLTTGIYNMVLKVYFKDKVITKTTTVNVVKDKLFRMPLVNASLTNVLFLIIVIIILIINLTLFVILMKKKDEHEKTKQEN